MRKLALLIVIVSTLLVSCGKDHSPITGPTTEEPNKPPIPDSTAIIVPVKGLLQPIPASDFTEKINFLVNKDYLDTHPESEVNILQMVEDVNAVLAKDPENEKRYVLGEVIPYEDPEGLFYIRTNHNYFFNNNFVGNRDYGGTTVVYWIQKDYNFPQFFSDMGGGSGFTMFTSIFGRVYGLVYFAHLATENPLLGKSNLPTYVNGLSGYYGYIAGLLHELGHTLFLGWPEGYMMHCSDNSGTLPNLSYDINEQYSGDPMNCADVVKYNVQEYKFSPSNSSRIRLNANHQLGGNFIDAVNGMKIQIKVVNESGPVPDADIKVYCGVSREGSLGTAVNMEKLLQETVTDSCGVASIKNSSSWFVIGVKAYSNGKYAGGVITTLDLEDACLRSLNTFVLTLTLK